MNRIRSTVFVLMSIAAAVLSGCMQTAPLYNPAFTVQASSGEAIHAAILKALADREWVVVSDKDRLVIARCDREEKSATVAIAFTSSKVSIELRSSTDLKQGKDAQGNDIIGSRYNTWVKNLEEDIGTNVAHESK